MEIEKIDSFINHLAKDEIYDAQNILKTAIQSKVDEKVAKYIDSGDAFSDFVTSDRFRGKAVTEAKIDYEDLATKMFKKFKGNLDKIKAELSKTYDEKDVNKIMIFVKKI